LSVFEVPAATPRISIAVHPFAGSNNWAVGPALAGDGTTLLAMAPLFERVVAGGCFCFPTFARDPWLESLREKPAFIRALRQAEVEHDKAARVFREHGGEKLVGV
jgi:hypothetical protein